MHSNKYDYDYGQRRPQSSRGSRPWDEDDRREEWEEPPKSSIRETYEKYIGKGHNVSTSDYGEPYSREYDSDTDWRNKRSSSREKRRRTLEDDDQYRNNREAQDSYRRSPENYSQRNREFKHAMPNGPSDRRTPERSRYSQPRDDFHYSEYKKDSHYRPANEFYRDRDSRERSRSPQRTRPREDFMKNYSPPRQRSGSFSRDHEDQYQNRTRFSLNGSNRLHEQSHRRLSPPPPPPPPPAAAAAGEKKMSTGFQRFLDVLNKGVDMETLTQIVTQGSPDIKPSSWPHMDRSLTESSQGQNPQHWPQTETRDWPSYNTNGKNVSEESHRYEEKRLSPTNNIPRSDEEHKRKQMHDVLQAIGIKLEFEELGQMSSRIQERLYGKKQPEIAPPNNEIGDKERERRRQPYAPKRRSRSSSDSSSGGSYQNAKTSHVYGAQWENKDFLHQTDNHGTQQGAPMYPAPVIPPPRQPLPPPTLPPPSPISNCPPSSYLPPTLPFVMPNVFMPPPTPFPHPFLPNLSIPPPKVFRTTGTLSQPVQQVQPLQQQPVKNRNPSKRHRYLQPVPTKK